MNNKLFVITGAPGAGKTSIINELKEHGFNIVEECARALIMEQLKIQGDVLPWGNLNEFNCRCTKYAIESYNEAVKLNEITFFDNGILELIAYNNYSKFKSSNELLKAANSLKYNNTVFIAPPWKEIYVEDEVRPRTYDDSVIIYDEIIKVYTQYGYNLVELPKLSINERTDFVINIVNKNINTI